MNTIMSQQFMANGDVLLAQMNYLIKEYTLFQYSNDNCYLCEAKTTVVTKKKTNSEQTNTENADNESEQKLKKSNETLISTIQRAINGIWKWIQQCLKNFIAIFRKRTGGVEGMYKEAVVDDSHQLKFLRWKYKNVATFDDSGLIKSYKNCHLSEKTIQCLQHIHGYNYNSIDKLKTRLSSMNAGNVFITSIQNDIKTARDASENLDKLCSDIIDEQRNSKNKDVEAKMNGNLFSGFYGIIADIVTNMDKHLSDMNDVISSYNTSLSSNEEKYQEKVANCRTMLMELSRNYQSALKKLKEFWDDVKGMELLDLMKFKWDLVHNKNEHKTNAREEYRQWMENRKLKSE